MQYQRETPCRSPWGGYIGVSKGLHSTEPLNKRHIEEKVRPPQGMLRAIGAVFKQ